MTSNFLGGEDLVCCNSPAAKSDFDPWYDHLRCTKFNKLLENYSKYKFFGPKPQSSMSLTNTLPKAPWTHATPLRHSIQKLFFE